MHRLMRAQYGAAQIYESPRRVPVGFRKMLPMVDLVAESARLCRGGPLLPGPAASRALLAVGAGGRLGPSLELGCSKGCSEVLSEPVEEPEENARMLRSPKGVCWDGSGPCREGAEGLCHEVRDCYVASLSCDGLLRAMHGGDGGTQAAAAVEDTLGLVAACRTELRGSCKRECAGGWLSASRATHVWNLSDGPCWLALHAIPACNKPSAQEMVGIVTLDHLLALSGRLHSPSMPPQMSVGPA